MRESSADPGRTEPLSMPSGEKARPAETLAAPDAGHRLPRRNKRRVRAMLGLTILFLAAGAAWGGWWYTNMRFVESTDDAYVAGNVLRIAPRIGGSVLDVLVDDHDVVTAGQPLVRLDAVDARLAWERALTDLAVPVREVGRLRAQLRQSEATVAMREVDLRQQTENLARREVLGRNNAIGKEEVRHARDGVATATAALRAAEEQRNALAALLPDGPLEEQPAVRQAAAAARDRWLALQRATVYSPVAGVVARRSVQAGEVVAPGAALMTVVPVEHLWVDANFKEGQLRGLRVGQSAVVHVDLYGSAVDYHGRVTGVSAGTGSAFSLMPAQNATGNWIKIVQRVPVRIELDPMELRQHPLLVGLSARVEVNTSDTSGPLLALAPRDTELPGELRSRAPEVDFAPAEAAIAGVIAANAAPPESAVAARAGL